MTNGTTGQLLKRALDVVASIGLLVLFSPLLVVVYVLVHTFLGRPVLFRHERPGRHARPFHLIKFRTMTNETDASGRLLPDSQRLTALGRFLRSTSVDELPELLNVLKGDMSLVGPRPLLTRYTAYFREAERCRFDVRPGITGLAQVRGRNDLSWDTRIAADVWYVRNWSLWLDLKILALTALQVVSRRGLQVDPGSVMKDLDEERRQSESVALDEGEDELAEIHS